MWCILARLLATDTFLIGFYLFFILVIWSMHANTSVIILVPSSAHEYIKSKLTKRKMMCTRKALHKLLHSMDNTIWFVLATGTPHSHMVDGLVNAAFFSSLFALLVKTMKKRTGGQHKILLKVHHVNTGLFVLLHI